MRIYMLPTPETAALDTSNSIHQIVLKLRDHLPQYGVEIVSNPSDADLVVGHAGQVTGDVQVVDVAHCHGLYPTGYADITSAWHFMANRAVAYNLVCAKRVTVPSQWVADILRRDMHINPLVVPWAIDYNEWVPGDNRGYVLWNKTRIDGVCSPYPLNELAARAKQVFFISTFGEPAANVRVIGRQEYPDMVEYIRHAGVYLATTKETFGIGTLEAMACGVPVLGFRHGATPGIVRHGVDGYLVSPGDYDGLLQGLEYCYIHRDILGANARLRAMEYSWDKTAASFAKVYQETLDIHYEKKVSIVIPCYNYGAYVAQAMSSAARQTPPEGGFEVIVVDDGSTDDSPGVIDATARTWNKDYPDRVRVIHQENSGVAAARNAGIRVARGKYIVCLDADDMLGDGDYIGCLSYLLDHEPTVGIAYSKLRMMDAEGNLGSVADWPGAPNYDIHITGQNRVPTCCMFRKEAWERVGGYRAVYTPAEDAELWLRIGMLGYRAALATENPWFLYRLHSNSLSSVVRTGQKKEPDWLSDKPWTRGVGHRPFASDGNPRMGSYPVINYDRPRVSIIVPVGPAHLGIYQEALDSIESQTDPFWECILVNDSGAVLDLTAYPWVRLVETGGYRGAAFSRNRGVEAATAPLISFLDADDLFDPRFLEKMLRTQAVYGGYTYCDWLSLTKDGQYEVHETEPYDGSRLFRKASIHSINIIMLRQDFLDTGGFDEHMSTWEDVEFFMRLASRGICGTRCPQPLTLYRYQLGTVREFGESVKQEMIAYLTERYGEYMRGEKEVCCGVEIRAMPGVALSSGGKPLEGADMVRIEYQGATGEHEVRGLVTRQFYGRRSRGDVFFVYLQDQKQAPSLFVPIIDTSIMMDPTPVPPEPVLEMS